MRHTILPGLLMALLITASPLAAQGPPPRAERISAGGPPSVAETFLARTGELRLTDAQVTRLAAIARRAEERRRAIAARLDSLAPRPAMMPPRDSAGRADRRATVDSATRAARQADVERMRNAMEQQREQARAELRDALAVLTPEQLVTAWEMRGAGSRAEVMRRAGNRADVLRRTDRGVDRPALRRDAAPDRVPPARGRPSVRRPPRDTR